MVCHVMGLRRLKSLLWMCLRTIKLKGILEGLLILLFIDSGASHNYITKELVTSLGLSLIDTWEFVITLGDGSKKASCGKCERLLITIGQK